MAVSMVGCGSKDADKNTEKKDTEVAATEKEAAAEDEAWEGDLTVWSPPGRSGYKLASGSVRSIRS